MLAKTIESRAPLQKILDASNDSALFDAKIKFFSFDRNIVFQSLSILLFIGLNSS